MFRAIWALLAAAVSVSAGCQPEPIPLPAPPQMLEWTASNNLSAKVIRSVPPGSLNKPEGWNAATAAEITGTAPLWQRGDTAVPIAVTGGTLLPYADTLARTGSGELYMARNTALLVRPDGQVVWFSTGSQVGGVAVPAPAGQWFWPGGGVPSGQGAVLFGSLWSPGGGVYGTRHGPAVSDFITAPAMARPVNLNPAITWGTPWRDGDTVYLPGFDPATWQQHLARHPYSPTAAGYVDGWTTQALQIDQGPLGPLSLRTHAGGWLATAKILGSAPELNYEETPEIFAWTSPTPTGPYRRVGVVHPDTRRPGTRSYQGSLQELPGAGLVASWSRNVMPGNTGGPDEYGTIFAPGWWPLRIV